MKDGVIGYYRNLTPLYASFHKDDSTFSLMWTEYDDDFSVFYERYIDNAERYGAVHGILGNGVPPENAYTVSEIPWFGFTSFSVHSYENKEYYFPSVEAGRFIEREGRTYLPLSLTLHHAATDGWHVKCFLEELEKDIKRFAEGEYTG